MHICYEMEQTFNLVFIGDLSDLFQQLHPEPVKLKKGTKDSPSLLNFNNINEFKKQNYKLFYVVLIRLEGFNLFVF